MEKINKTFKSSYLLRIIKGDYNPFTPNVITVTDEFVEYRRRNWHLISVDKQKYYFKNIYGIDVDKHIFGADINIVGINKIVVRGFSKKNANRIYNLTVDRISKTNQSTATIVNNHQLSTADELKKLKDLLNEGVLNEKEYESEKAKLLNK